MANLVALTIDGKAIQVPEGTNLVDAAAQAGVHIPNLCYLKGMKGIGACRLCMVEIEGLKAPMTACTTRVKEGMVVNTQTEKVQEVRKFVIDLILSMHPLDCMTCTKAGVCRLQQYAYDFEIKESSFTRKSFGYPTDEANPFIMHNPDYCILCGRCVRACKEQGTSVLEFMGRGVGSKVTTATERPLQESGCTFCGSCIDACPVNAFLEADRWRKGREWEYQRTASVCLQCGSSCDIEVCTKDGQISKITSASSEGYLCAYGRFGFEALEADTRITKPMRRIEGTLQETTWEDALDTVAQELRKARGKAGFITNAGILNEDALTLKRFASDIVGTKNVDTTAHLYGDSEGILSEGAELEDADLLILVDLGPDQWKRVLPGLDVAIRKRVNAGTKLITFNKSNTALASLASVVLTGNEMEALEAFIKAAAIRGVRGHNKLTRKVSAAGFVEHVDAAAALFAEAKRPLVLSSPLLFHAASNIALMKGSAVSVPLESNAKGVLLMGLIPEGKSYREMVSGGAEVLYAVGEQPFTERPQVKFLVVQQTHMTELAKQADVVFPAAAPLESEGTISDYLRRVRKVSRAVLPPGEAKMHREIFKKVAERMGSVLKVARETEVRKRTKAKIRATMKPFIHKIGFDADACRIVHDLNRSVIENSRLLWLKDNECSAKEKELSRKAAI